MSNGEVCTNTQFAINKNHHDAKLSILILESASVEIIEPSKKRQNFKIFKGDNNYVFKNYNVGVSNNFMQTGPRTNCHSISKNNGDGKVIHNS